MDGYKRLRASINAIDGGYKQGLPPAMMLARQDGYAELASADFLNPRNYNMAALRTLLAYRHEEVPDFHRKSAKEARMHLAEIADKAGSFPSLTFAPFPAACLKRSITVGRSMLAVLIYGASAPTACVVLPCAPSSPRC